MMMTASEWEPVSLRDHLRVLRRRWWLLLLVVAVCVGGAAAYAFLTAPVYEARAELVVAREEGPRSAVLAAAAPVLSMLGDPVSALGRDDLATQMQIIDSRPSLEDAWGLMRERPEVLGSIATDGLSEELLEQLPGIVATLEDQPPPTRWPDEWQALLDTLTIAPVEESEIIEVRGEAADAERARDFTNALVLAYLGRSLADARATTRRTRSYVEQQLSDVEVRLAEAEESLRQFGERVGTVALDESARQQVGLLVRLNEQAAIAESTLNSQKALRDELEAELSAVDERVIASTVTRRNPEIMALQEELARTEAERASLLEEYAPESLPVRRATAGVEDLRARLRETAVEVVDSRQESINPLAQEIAQEMIVAEGEQMAAEQSMRVLRGAAARAESELSGLPAEQVALLRLQREIELLERFYLALKEKQQEFEISERMKAPASRLVSHAITSDEPARPKKLLTIAGGLVAGLLLGLLTVGLAEQLDERMQDPQHVATVLGVPVIGVLAGRGRESEGESAEEALRSIRQHVRALSRGSTGANVLVVASDGDAGVRVAEGLARVAREQGERAIILARGEHASEIEAELTAALSPQAETDAVEPPGGASGADLIVVATQASSGLSGAAALLEAGYPVAVVVDIDRTSAAVASGLAELARRHGAGPVVAVVTGGRRSAACYLTRKTRT